MNEKETKKVNISDIHPSVFSEMLKYIYTGKLPQEDNNIRELLAAANKYQIDMLKNICIVKMCNSININNCIYYLIDADIYEAQFLKKFSLKFIANNVKNICKKDNWRSILIDYPELMADVINAIGKNED